MEVAKEEGAYILLTNCPSYILSLEKGLELMRESDKPMEFGIFDFYKVFSRAFGEEEDGAARCMLVNNLDHGYLLNSQMTDKILSISNHTLG